MRLIRTIDTRPDADGEQNDASEESSSTRRFWYWYELPKVADDANSRHARKPVKLNDHTNDVTKALQPILGPLDLSDGVKAALALAAQWHDVGKDRNLWQSSVGNLNRDCPLAKSGNAKGRTRKIDYRHEFGSMLDLQNRPEFAKLDEDVRDLVLHAIAAHHGRARPHFPHEEVYDPQATVDAARALAAEVPQRFARLQRKYGRWGLAYLESLLRAADYTASANPTVQDEPGDSAAANSKSANSADSDTAKEAR